MLACRRVDPPDDISPEFQRRIDDLWIALDLLNHYELLEVSRTATHKAIRDAYFLRAKEFHSDTVFTKKVGPYRKKMDAIASRLNQAYEVLSKSRSRAAYDAELPPEPPPPSEPPPPAAPTTQALRMTTEERRRRAAEQLRRGLPPKSEPVVPSKAPRTPEEMARELTKAGREAAASRTKPKK